MGNHIYTFDSEHPTRIRIAAGNAVLLANVLENAVIDIDDETGTKQPIRLEANIFQHSRVVHHQGNLIPPALSGERPH
jgi:hypothetical protein